MLGRRATSGPTGRELLGPFWRPTFRPASEFATPAGAVGRMGNCRLPSRGLRPLTSVPLSTRSGSGHTLGAVDATGNAVQRTLVDRVKAHPNIAVLDWHIAIDLITTRKLGRPGNRCLGAYVLDKSKGEVVTIGAEHTALASGGARVAGGPRAPARELSLDFAA